MYVTLLSTKRENYLKVKVSHLYRQTLKTIFPLPLEGKKDDY